MARLVGFLLISFASFSRQYIFVDGMKIFSFVDKSEVMEWNEEEMFILE
jgi:hypothetical protein